MKRPPHDGDEQDAFSHWRRVTRWQRGEIRAIKRRSAKRDRRIARDEIKDEIYWLAGRLDVDET
jgi:hypothetical protein